MLVNLSHLLLQCMNGVMRGIEHMVVYANVNSLRAGTSLAKQKNIVDT